MRDPGLRVVGHRAAQLLEAHLLAGHRLDHVGAGDEHVRGLLHHEDEVRDRRGVDGAARARAHDQADLRDHAGAPDVAHEHVSVGAERDDALLDARAARVVDADHRAADLRRQVHDLAHLLAHHLAERAAEHGEVLAEHAHRAPVDRAVAGHHRVAPRPVLLHVEVVGAVAYERVELLEGARVEQLLHALARGVLAARVLLLLRLGRAVQRRLAQLVQLRELLLVGLGRLLARRAAVAAARRGEERRIRLAIVRGTRHRRRMLSACARRARPRLRASAAPGPAPLGPRERAVMRGAERVEHGREHGGDMLGSRLLGRPQLGGEIGGLRRGDQARAR